VTGSVATRGSAAVAGSSATTASVAVAGSSNTSRSVGVAGSTTTRASVAVAGSVATLASVAVAGSALTFFSAAVAGCALSVRVLERRHVEPDGAGLPRAVGVRLAQDALPGAAMPKGTPCGSLATITRSPPGTSIGPACTWPPPAFTFSAAASMSGTRK
jgi:hypothetical protein